MEYKYELNKTSYLIKYINSKFKYYLSNKIIVGYTKKPQIKNTIELNSFIITYLLINNRTTYQQ
jgi:hypothetical protein